MPKLFKSYFFFGFFCLISGNLLAQTTTINGRITDRETKEALPFVNVGFPSQGIGTTADIDGYFTLTTNTPSDSLVASFIGYFMQKKGVVAGSTQTINFEMVNSETILQEVVVTAKKGRYRNRNNPAVELIKKVREHADQNRMKGADYLEYEKYEKIEFDLNNISQKFRDRKAFKNFQYVFEFVDTSQFNGKSFLPIFLQETLSKVYFRGDPKTQKEYQDAIKLVGFDGYVDNEGINYFLDKVYEDVDIYDNSVTLLSQQFVSPISPLGPITYKYFIVDTIDYNGRRAIDLQFLPRNKLAIAFSGNLLVDLDSTSYAVMKANLRVGETSGLNFVNDLQLTQTFEPSGEGTWLMSKNEFIVDFSLSGKDEKTGFFGKRTVTYQDYLINHPRPDSIYSGLENIVKADDAFDKDEIYWSNVRHEELSLTESSVYIMIDSVQELPAFRRTMDIITLLATGYKDFGPVSIGPLATFYSFNDIEGFRLRVGGRTNLAFSEKVQLEGYGAYGFGDKNWKYAFGVTYSFNKSLFENPKHEIRAVAKHETTFPGLVLRFANEDNFLLSFRRGNNNLMFFNDTYSLEYLKEFRNRMTFKLGVKHERSRPLGDLSFAYLNREIDDIDFLDDITTAEYNVNFRWAPNEKFYQGANYRISYYSKYPIFNLGLIGGVKGVLGGDYNYSRLIFNMYKRTYVAPIGYFDTEIEAGKIFGTVPYNLLAIPPANQTYAYQLRSFNMMNFLEFVSDQYVSFQYSHYFNGFFTNKIPLIRRLKWREIFTAKVIYGGVRDANDPNVNENQVRFPVTPDGVPITYTLESKPYVELSAGIYNLFKVMRIDIVKRMTYLDNPNVPKAFGVRGVGIRFHTMVEF